MTYSAQFNPPKRLGDMFQSINGDVWIVIRTWAELTNGLPRYAQVQRVAVYDPSWIAPRFPPDKCYICGHGFTKRSPDASPITKPYHWVCLNRAGYGWSAAALAQGPEDERDAQIELSKGVL